MQVAVIIPIYRLPLSDDERLSLDQVCHILKGYPLIAIHPVSLDLSPVLHDYPDLQAEEFDDSYFKGIAGYNQLMLSTECYGRFLKWDYILIYQLDAWVFRDELQAWCEKGYDYIGAPWLEKPVYRLPLIASFMRMRHKWLLKQGKPSPQSFYNKIGNGGLSLRRVKSHYAATSEYKNLIDSFLSKPRSHFFNEDVFWATQLPEFVYPDAREALLFAFDKYPAYCYRLTNGQLPFGCHGWNKRKMKRFWTPIIKR